MNQPDNGSGLYGRGVSSVSLTLERHPDVLSTEIPSVVRPLFERDSFRWTHFKLPLRSH